MQHLPGIEMSGCICITALFCALPCSQHEIVFVNDLNSPCCHISIILSCKSSQTVIFPLFMTFLCVPLNSQPVGRHGHRQGLVCSTQNLYSTYHSGGVEFACVTHKVV
jgi:hypothetical protein